MTDRQCPSCGGFCKKECERADVKQSEHEPVAWMWKDGSLTSDPDEADGTWTKLYAAPPKREWVEITKGEISEIWGNLPQTRDEEQDAITFGFAIEAKLKEKNT